MEEIKMTVSALREIMGSAFDFTQYDQGRKDAYKFFTEHRNEPTLVEERLTEVRRRIRYADFKHTSGPSYWLGCLTEADWTWRAMQQADRSDDSQKEDKDCE